MQSYRDIKGSNILEDPNGIIKVADFGMAKHVCIFFLKLHIKYIFMKSHNFNHLLVSLN